MNGEKKPSGTITTPNMRSDDYYLTKLDLELLLLITNSAYIKHLYQKIHPKIIAVSLSIGFEISTTRPRSKFNFAKSTVFEIKFFFDARVVAFNTKSFFEIFR